MGKDKELIVRPEAKPPVNIELIKPTPRDRLLKNMQTLKSHPPAVGSEYEYNDHVKRFNSAFSNLCWMYFNLTSVQQLRLKKADLVALSEEVAARAKKAFLWRWALTLPTLGFSWVFMSSHVRKYFKAYKSLKEHYGQNYFPYQQFQAFLGKDINASLEDSDEEDEEYDQSQDEDLAD